MKRTGSVIVSMLCSCALSQYARANLVIDQSVLPPSTPTASAAIWNQTQNVPAVLQVAQTFTVGLDGTLQQVDVLVNNLHGSEPLMMRVLGTTPAGLPDTTDVLSTMTLSASFFPSLSFAYLRTYALTTSQWVPVHKGELLAIELSENTLDTSGIYGWYGSDASTYSGGASYNSDNNSNSWLQLPSSELGFQTWVDTPEPSLLFPVGVGLILLARRRGPLAPGEKEPKE